MKTFLINPAWDAAGVSIRQANAINKYTNWKARHFRAIPTFNYPTDMIGEKYNKDEFISVVKESDVIHFCSCPHTYTKEFNFGVNWSELLKNKVVILHDYAFFEVRWTVLRDSKEKWNLKQQLGYNDIWSSLPQGVHIFKDCYYMPDVVDETEDMFKADIRTFDCVKIGHFPTGDGNRKNTNELNAAIQIVKYKVNIESIIERGIANEEIIKIKQRINLGFDALWRGFHGMTTVENLAMGIPTMVNIEPEFIPVFMECFQTNFLPFERTSNVSDIANTIITYAKDLESLKQRSLAVKDFMRNTWSAKNIALKITNRYEKLLEKV